MPGERSRHPLNANNCCKIAISLIDRATKGTDEYPGFREANTALMIPHAFAVGKDCFEILLVARSRGISLQMTFQRKPANEKLRHQIHTSLNDDTWEKWHYLCEKHNRSSHSFLREVVQEYCERHLASGYTVLEAFKQKRY